MRCLLRTTHRDYRRTLSGLEALRSVRGRHMRVVMRKPEADSIAMHLQNMQTKQPMTYSFMAVAVQALGDQPYDSRRGESGHPFRP
jgi:hypothetical protein